MSDPGAPREVLVVAPGGLRGPGGIGRLVNATVRYWRYAGMQPSLRIVDTYGAALSAATAVHFLRAAVEVVWHTRRGRVAAVHIHMAARGSTVRKGVIAHLAKWSGVPVLLHLHGSRLDEFHAGLPDWGRRMLRRTLASADCIVAPGRYWRDVLVDTVGLDPATIQIVSNAAAGPSEVPRRPQRPTCELLFLGNLSGRKGLPELLEALADPALAALGWRLRIAGDGDPAPFAARAAELGLGNRVAFLGWRSEADVRALLADSDVFVLPSHNEGLSIALLEAMAHGCAVVTTPVGATLDALIDGECALLVPVGDRHRLATALCRAIADPELRAALQTGARRRWREHFDIADHCRQIQALYRQLCDPAPHHAHAACR
jgi:glycosyltransferase involved in cell wall biosynthesis